MSKQTTKKQSKTDWDRIDALRDQAIDYSEVSLLDKRFFQSAVLRMPQSKALLTIRLDRDVLEWFKKAGPRYQTRINALLRAYMEANQRLAG